MRLCFFARFSDSPCSGRIDPCHLIPQQRLKAAGLSREEIWDDRVWEPGCRHHHGLFDFAKTIRLTPEDYPHGLRAFAAEYGFFWAGTSGGWRKENR